MIGNGLSNSGGRRLLRCLSSIAFVGDMDLVEHLAAANPSINPRQYLFRQINKAFRPPLIRRPESLTGRWPAVGAELDLPPRTAMAQKSATAAAPVVRFGRPSTTRPTPLNKAPSPVGRRSRLGDSGSGVFYENPLTNSELTGMMYAVGNYPNQTLDANGNPPATAITPSTGTSSIADLSAYRSTV